MKRDAADCASGFWRPSLYTGSAMHGPPLSMLYWLYRPPCAPPGGMPLLVMLHGCEQDANTFAQGTRMNQVAARMGFAVAYPQQSKAIHPQRCWKWYDRAVQRGGGEAALVAGMVGEIGTRYPIDRSRIYMCGFSAGAAMAHIVAINYPGLVAGVGIHSGPLFGAARGAAAAVRVMLRGDARRVESAIGEVHARHPAFPPMPAILIHGEQDSVVRTINQKQLEQQSLLLNRVPEGAPVEIVLHERTADAHAYQVRDVRAGGRLLVRAVQVAGLKHAWSGGDASLRFNSAPGPDASGLLAGFFLQHSRQTGTQAAP